LLLSCDGRVAAPAFVPSTLFGAPLFYVAAALPHSEAVTHHGAVLDAVQRARVRYNEEHVRGTLAWLTARQRQLQRISLNVQGIVPAYVEVVWGAVDLSDLRWSDTTPVPLLLPGLTEDVLTAHAPFALLSLSADGGCCMWLVGEEAETANIAQTIEQE